MSSSSGSLHAAACTRAARSMRDKTDSVQDLLYNMHWASFLLLPSLRIQHTCSGACWSHTASKILQHRASVHLSGLAAALLVWRTHMHVEGRQTTTDCGSAVPSTRRRSVYCFREASMNWTIDSAFRSLQKGMCPTGDPYIHTILHTQAVGEV